MRLTLCAGDHAVRISGLPKGMTPEAIADVAHLLRNELIALWTGTEHADEPIPAEPDAT